MGLFSRRKPEPAPAAWQPPSPPHCACTRHLDDELLAAVVPYTAALVEDIGYTPEPATVGGLLHPGGPVGGGHRRRGATTVRLGVEVRVDREHL